MDLLLVRLAGSRPPAVDTLRAALQRQPWLTPEPGRRGVWARAFVFPGGHVQALRKLPDEPRYEAPGVLATLTPDADFATVAPRLVALAGELRLGIDTPRSSGSLWWEAPDSSTLEPNHLERAVAADSPRGSSRSCRSCQPIERVDGEAAETVNGRFFGERRVEGREETGPRFVR